MGYHVGHNMPGYLPESDVFCTRDLETAKSVWVDEIERAADSIIEGATYGYDPSLDDVVDVAKSHSLGELSSGAYVMVGNCAYWVEPYECSGDCDDENSECPGHESLNGSDMGESVHCDGSCQG